MSSEYLIWKVFLDVLTVSTVFSVGVIWTLQLYAFGAQKKQWTFNVTYFLSLKPGIVNAVSIVITLRAWCYWNHLKSDICNNLKVWINFLSVCLPLVKNTAPVVKQYCISTLSALYRVRANAPSFYVNRALLNTLLYDNSYCYLLPTCSFSCKHISRPAFLRVVTVSMI